MPDHELLHLEHFGRTCLSALAGLRQGTIAGEA
jgi:hypothetical protein